VNAEDNAKMSIKWKIIIPMAIIVTVLTATTITLSTVKFTEYTSTLFNEMINVSADGVRLFISDSEAKTKAAALSATENRDVIRAIRNRDKDAIIKTLDSVGLYGVDLLP